MCQLSVKGNASQSNGGKVNLPAIAQVVHTRQHRGSSYQKVADEGKRPIRRFATPLVSRQLASIYHRITPMPLATLARTILTHNAVDIRTREQVKDGDDHYLGFETPLDIDRALECDP
jgi:hypothetical protein